MNKTYNKFAKPQDIDENLVLYFQIIAQDQVQMRRLWTHKCYTPYLALEHI